jgi:hypothetical protein
MQWSKFVEFAPDATEGALAGELPTYLRNSLTECAVDSMVEQQERQDSMKRALVLGTLIFAVSLCAHAQSRTPNGGGAYNPNAVIPGGNGGNGGLGGVNPGPTVFNVLPHDCPTQFTVAGVSGSDADFEPSSFLSFDKAVALGQAEETAMKKTIADAARDNAKEKAANAEKAKLAVVEDSQGRLVLAAR